MYVSKSSREFGTMCCMKSGGNKALIAERWFTIGGGNDVLFELGTPLVAGV